ncbi:unnamed protein product [Symbiodinium natans]|uniref:CHAT domain-containing protein n=1 Tax=Symbiodinium natans TaxID=878477 RepID=A0A812IDX9_9DINO|nr:unnamed protein product [Symbiodinium natans]
MPLLDDKEPDKGQARSGSRFKSWGRFFEEVRAKIPKAKRITPLGYSSRSSGVGLRRTAAEEVAGLSPHARSPRRRAEGCPYHGGGSSGASRSCQPSFFAPGAPREKRSPSGTSLGSGSHAEMLMCTPRELHETPGFYMEGLSVDSTPTTEYRLSSFSNCSSPPVNDESSYGSSFMRVSSQDNCKEVYCLYASPLGHPAINVRSEVETIQEAFEESASGTRLNVGVATVQSLSKLLTLAKSQKGLVLHLSAHSIRSDKGDVGLVLEDSCGKAHVLWKKRLEEILGMKESGLRSVSLLFLSTCWSQELAQVFVECGCPHVVCLRSPVYDVAARRFSQQFYLSLGVGESLLSAWQTARSWLCTDSKPELAEQADHFVLFGQRGADKVTLSELCGEEADRAEASNLRKLEAASRFLVAESLIPPRPENFLGRPQFIHEVLHLLSGHESRRACAVWGAEGIGKSAFGVEFAHFATAPGRPFSCSSQILKIESNDAISVAHLLLDGLEALANQLEVSLRPCSGDSRSSLCSCQSAPQSVRSEVANSASMHLGSDQELMSSLLPVRQRIRRGFRQIERVRRKAPVLLVVDDEVGAFTSSDVRKLFGELLEHTCHLHLLVLSRTPIYSSLGPSKVVNVALPGLEEYDAAKLFLQRMHRKLEAQDFPADPMGSADAGGGVQSREMGATTCTTRTWHTCCART